MLYARKSLGIEINPASVAFALLGGSSSSPRLERVSTAPLPPGTVRASLRDANILDPKTFSNSLCNAHNLLLYSGRRLSVSLPDSVGRVLLLDMEGRFKNRSEALDMIRWKLKKSLPFEIADTHLDYQQLTVRDNGDMALMVALVSKSVIGQYEELLVASGFVPARIDLNSFNLYRAFENRLSLQEDVTLISFYAGTLNIMVFAEGVLEFSRIKDMSGSSGLDNRVYMEISSSLMAYHERFPERIVQHVSCVAPPGILTEFRDMLAEATGFEPALLEIKSSVKPADSVPADQESLYPFTTAIGAALRSL